MNKVLCIYHDNCADGFGAAWAVHRALGDDVEFVAAKYGDNPPAGTKWCDKDCSCDPEETPVCSLRGRDILIVDFSYPLATLRAMAAEARSVLVLDHHKTAQKDLLELPTIGVPYKTWLAYNGKDQAPYPAAIFDMDRSGAGITWDYLSGGQPRPRIIDLVEDRDLWRFKHDPDTRRFHAVAASYGYEATPANFARWDEWDQTSLPIGAVVLTGTWADLMNEGEAILRYERQLVEGIVHSTRRTMRIAGHVVPVACVPGALASEAGNLLCTNDEPCPTCKDGLLYGSCTDCLGTGVDHAYDVPFSATYYDTARHRHFSLRSPEGGADVGEIAKRYGGGGHAHSSGFAVAVGWEGE